MADLYDTRATPQSQRMAFWLETVCEQILPVKIDPRHDAQPVAAMNCLTLGDLAIRDVVGGDHVYVRDQDDIRVHDPETVQIGIPTGGSSILVQDGREAILEAGDMVLYDSSRPFTLVMQDRFHWRVFLLPKHKLRRSDQELRNLTAVRMRGTDSVSGVVSHFLLDLAQRGAQLENRPSIGQLGENAADLIATLIQSEFGRPWNVNDPVEVLRKQVFHVIAKCHADPDLDPAGIASQVGVSLRRLHQLVADSPHTVMEHVRVHRLNEIRRDLCDPRIADRPIHRIAAAHGMVNPSVFARAFRQEFRQSPTAFRARALAELAQGRVEGEGSYAFD